jgi:hypothetical protein
MYISIAVLAVVVNKVLLLLLCYLTIIIQKLRPSKERGVNEKPECK